MIISSKTIIYVSIRNELGKKINFSSINSNNTKVCCKNSVNDVCKFYANFDPSSPLFKAFKYWLLLDFNVVTFTTFTYMFIHPNLFTPAISITWLSILKIRITNWTMFTIFITNTWSFNIKVVDSFTLAFWTILIRITARAWLAFYRTKNFDFVFCFFLQCFDLCDSSQK